MAHSGQWLGLVCGLRSLRSLSPQATQAAAACAFPLNTIKTT